MINSKKSVIARGILAAVGAVGLVAVAIVAPNIIGTLAQISPQLKKFNPKQVNRSLKNLEKNGLISIRQDGDKILIELTKNGQKKILTYKLDELRIKPAKKWDRKWRVVIFDIPEKFKRNRYEFSFRLKTLGFIQLQKSVWICPYPCEDEVDFLKEIYLIGPFVRIMTVEKIDIAHDLFKKFRLPGAT